MTVPFEAILPLAIIWGAVTAGTKLADLTHRHFSNGKTPRYRTDAWDQMMIQRDEYIMGKANVQMAPFGVKS